MSIEARLKQRLAPRLARLYGDRAAECLEKILTVVRRFGPGLSARPGPLWDERDVVLITYGDQVRSPGIHSLSALGLFLEEAGLDKLLSTIHLLPFFPYSSDDGFSVIDYCTVDPSLGDWSDIRRLGESYALMFDLVLNHVSRQSRWFADYLAGREPYTRYFIELQPEADISSVTRPRSGPLLTPVETSRGRRHLWTTFSPDQIDLNFAEPDVLVEIVGVLLFYLEQGARIIRLDAIAYLWKELGTPCIHLPQTHEVVKVLRGLVDELAPGTILLTETNVPHEENFSYFGNGDEAQMVYQFSLAPLLLEALLSGDGRLLVDWLDSLEPTPPGTTVFNFTASHDGIGVRPLEGIMPPNRHERLIEAVEARGGYVSMKRNADGTDSPYELNITYSSALADTRQSADSAFDVPRFLASQALMLSMRGIPGVYFHSLVATPNDTAGVERTGRARSINRRKLDLAELRSAVVKTGAAAACAPARVFEAYRRLLAVRIAQPAFHPEAEQQVVRLGSPSLVGFIRTSLDRQQRILVLGNLGPRAETFDIPSSIDPSCPTDLLSTTKQPLNTPTVTLAPYQVAWVVV